MPLHKGAWEEPNDVVADADCATVLVDFNGSLPQNN